MANNKFEKDPDEILDYGLDWTNWLDGDEISTSTWKTIEPLTSPPLEYVSGSESASTTNTLVFVSGGKEGVTYKLTNAITTTNSPSRTAERTLYITIKEK